MKRVQSIDLVRGIVMIIMALDHTRDMFHETATTIDPLDLTKTTTAAFLTRLITHLCAPTFVFLSGVSAWLSMRNRKDVSSSRAFLLKRGLWLIILDVTLISLGIFYDLRFGIIMFQVIGAIGFGFLMIALLMGLPSRVVGFIGLAIIVLHNTVTLLPSTGITMMLSPLFIQSLLPIGPDHNLLIGYPPIPWLGVILAGYGFAKNFLRPSAERKSLFLKLGIGSIALFVILRIINVYGDPNPWTSQSSPLFTVLSFLNVTKYPPSLMFDLLFLGIMFLLLRIFDKVGSEGLAGAVKIYGKVPMFYYLIHWHLLHLLMFIVLAIQGYGPKDYSFGFNMGRPQAPNGLPLWGAYLVWIFVVVIMYPLCAWYNKYKIEHPEKTFLRYL